MDEQYRLVFRGEVVQGQHAAVVKKRLATVLKLDDEKVEQLFGGATVVLRRSVDRQTAAQFQAAFKKAGAKLRVQPIVSSESQAEATTNSPEAAAESSSPTPSQPARESNAAAAADASGLRVLPVGSLLLEVHERLPPVEANIPVSHLALDDAAATTAPSEEATAEPVNVDHISVADVGAQIGAEDAEEIAPLDFDFTFELAEDGSWLKDEAEQEAAPIAAPDYTLAEPGAQLAPETKQSDADVEPPDVSHLSLRDDEPST